MHGQVMSIFERATISKCHPTFQTAHVSMPIGLIGEIDEDNCETTFRNNGGTINSLDSGNSIDFINRCGVYFVKMKVPRRIVDGPSKGFARPGLA